MLRRARQVTLALAAVIVASACAKNPVTGQRQLSLISEKQEIALGQQGAKEVTESLGLVEDEELQRYVSRLGKQLADETERPKLPWSFAVVDDAAVNAFALPGGYIFVTRGMLAHLTSEAELAMVLGHEIGHVTAKHSVSMMSQAQLAQIGLSVGMILVPELQQFGQLAGAGMQLMFLKFGRDAERQADDLGFGYALEDRYDVREGAEVFGTLDRVSKASGQGRLPEWLSTHPNPENREKTLKREAKKVKVDWARMTRNERELLSHLDGLVYGEDPRAGFFDEGNVFKHPELRLQMAFPRGWKTQNLPQVVAALSPEEDAAVILGVVPSPSAEAAAREFTAQKNVEAQPATGCGSLCYGFQARTDQGVLQGFTSFASHRGRTFQVVAYAPAERFSARRDALADALQSFEPLDDPKALAVQPARLDVVVLEQPMTLEEFARRYPSTVPLGELELINGVEKKDELPAGAILKRVIGGRPASQGQARG